MTQDGNNVQLSEFTETVPDPIGQGERSGILGYLLGKPLLGMRVEDALAAADFVAYYQKKRDNPRKVHLVGVGRAGIVALHAAALHPEQKRDNP
jgi:pimeloyl-ACP methyl ester carboxylesterase